MEAITATPVRSQSRRPLNARLILLAVVAVIAVGIGAKVAFASTHAPAVGTGVVVIDTKLGYANGEAAGTGIVLTSSGEILTNNHVIKGATAIKIVIPGTGHVYTATVLGYDATRDVALIRARGASHLKTAAIGDSSALRLEQAVHATGNAGGTGAFTTVSGEITGLGQAITVSDDDGGTENLSGLIETDAPIQPGDSGGPLINGAGKVIGMDTAASAGNGRFVDSANDGYAIPIKRAVAIAAQIESGTAPKTVHIGATALLGVDISPGESYYGSGAFIEDVVTASPAAKAGLAPGDFITSVGGHKISGPAALSAVILSEKVGSHVSVTYVDGAGDTYRTTVKLASGPPQ